MRRRYACAMSTVGTPDRNSGWLSEEDLADARRRAGIGSAFANGNLGGSTTASGH